MSEESPVPGKRRKDMTREERLAHDGWRARLRWARSRVEGPKGPPNGKRIKDMSREEKRAYDCRKKKERMARLKANPDLWEAYCRNTVRWTIESRTRKKARETKR